MKKTFPIFTLSKNSDQTEGRGRDIPVARFTSHAEAVKVNEDPRFYKMHGVMGTKYDAKYSIKTENLEIFETAEEYFSFDKDAVKKAALAKLSTEEKIALGLPVN